jgi:hypothetical protein
VTRIVPVEEWIWGPSGPRRSVWALSDSRCIHGVPLVLGCPECSPAPAPARRWRVPRILSRLVG